MAAFQRPLLCASPLSVSFYVSPPKDSTSQLWSLSSICSDSCLEHREVLFVVLILEFAPLIGTVWWNGEKHSSWAGLLWSPAALSSPGVCQTMLCADILPAHLLQADSKALVPPVQIRCLPHVCWFLPGALRQSSLSLSVIDQNC